MTNLTETESYLWLPEFGCGGWENWVKVVRMYKLPVTRQVSSGGVMYQNFDNYI